MKARASYIVTPLPSEPRFNPTLAAIDALKDRLAAVVQRCEIKTGALGKERARADAAEARVEDLNRQPEQLKSEENEQIRAANAARIRLEYKLKIAKQNIEARDKRMI